MKKNKTFYVTTPIYYPSGNLHIGHVYTTTLAWILRNYKRLRGYDAILLTGSDEHGQKIELRAQQMNLEPQKYVDKMAERFKKLWENLEIDYDFFARTSNPQHVLAVQKQFSQFLKNQYIYKNRYKGWYSIEDEEYVSLSNALVEDGKYFHPISHHQLEKRDEEAYFFKMNKFENWIKQYYLDEPSFIYPFKIQKELEKNFLADNLSDLSISRNNFSWGIPIEEDKEHVLYVWIDALNNYISTLGYNSNDDENFQKYWVNGDEIVHLVGREISRFHCIYWPIILKAANLRLPTKIINHGWIITPEGKMSKSKGNIIDPQKLLIKYEAEQVKYFFASQIKIGQDGIFDEQIFKNVVNADLTNNYGNLLSRTISMINQNFQEPVKFNKNLTSLDQELVQKINDDYQKYLIKMDDFKIDSALNIAINLSKRLNGYIDQTKPWTLKNEKTRLALVLNILLNGLYAVSAMLSIVLPQKTKVAREQLNVPSFEFEKISDFTKFDNIIVKKGEVLFKRLK